MPSMLAGNSQFMLAEDAVAGLLTSAFGKYVAWGPSPMLPSYVQTALLLVHPEQIGRMP